MTTVVIPARFFGPPGSGNGGYSCGAIAEAVGERVEVTLRQPPPLDTELQIVRADDAWAVMDGDRLIAQATPTGVPPEPPTPPTLAEAEDAATRYLGLVHHDFPGCFTCGPGRTDNLRIFSGAVPSTDLVAAPWTPDPSLPTRDGAVTVPIVWAAIDCPGAWTAMRTETDKPVVLGRMAAHVARAPAIGEPTISYGWPGERSGRKALAGTALATTDGELLAWASQVWVELAIGD